MFKSIFKAVAVSAVAAFFCVGCGDKSDDGPGDDDVRTNAPYTITFNAGDGTVSPTSAKTGEDGKLASLPTPTRSGYAFDGWYTAATGGTAVSTGTAFSKDATIYARWTAGSGYTGKGNDISNYRVVQIGTQKWMAENLDYNVPGSKCYDNSNDNCAKYGRLYDWATAMGGASSSSASPSGVRGVCPVGWHIPSSAEWTTLTDFVGEESVGDWIGISSGAGTKLKSPEFKGLGGAPAGTDDYGFSALPGGSGNSDGSFGGDAGSIGYWWTATEFYDDDAGFRMMTSITESVQGLPDDKGSLYSVRCLEDYEPARYVSKGNDINNYRVVQIGTQKWMAENLDYDVAGSVCRGNDSANCAKYGRLYNWTTAMKIDTMYNRQEWKGSGVEHQGICPDKWHIPSDVEWTALMDYVGGDSVAGKKLKSQTGWLLSGNGTDEYGFTALSGGQGTLLSGNSFFFLGSTGNWWSATESSDLSAWYREVNYDREDVERGTDPKGTNLYSVRCVADGSTTYTITFDYNYSGSTSTTATTGTGGKLASLPTPPTRSRYTFSGWYTTAASGGGTAVTIDYVYSANTTIYARWADVKPEVNEGWPPSGILSKYGVGSLTEPPGATAVRWGEYETEIEIAGFATDSFSYFEDYFTSNGWTLEQEERTSKSWRKSSQSRTLEASYQEYIISPGVFTITVGFVD